MSLCGGMLAMQIGCRSDNDAVQALRGCLTSLKLLPEYYSDVLSREGKKSQLVIIIFLLNLAYF